MSRSPRPARSSVFRLSNEARQQRILRAIARVADPDITAWARTDGDEFFIVASSRSATADVHLRRIVMSIDLSATRVMSSAELYDGAPPRSACVGRGGFTRIALSGLRRLV